MEKRTQDISLEDGIYAVNVYSDILTDEEVDSALINMDVAAYQKPLLYQQGCRIPFEISLVPNCDYLRYDLPYSEILKVCLEADCSLTEGMLIYFLRIHDLPLDINNVYELRILDHEPLAVNYFKIVDMAGSSVAPILTFITHTHLYQCDSHICLNGQIYVHRVGIWESTPHFNTGF